MSVPDSQYVTINPESPEALGVCDRSGFVHNRKDLVRQMEWRGNALVWTGFYVGKTFLDKPNEQLRTPMLPPDPVPIMDPRPLKPTTITWENNFQYNWENLPVQTWETWSGCDDGIPVLPESERLLLLQQGGNFGVVRITGGGYINQPQLTEDEKLEELETFNWNS